MSSTGAAEAAAAATARATAASTTSRRRSSAPAAGRRCFGGRRLRAVGCSTRPTLAPSRTSTGGSARPLQDSASALSPPPRPTPPAPAPLGPGTLRRFLPSCAAREAGSAHELTILLTGLGAPGAADRGLLLGEVGERPHRLVELAEPALALAAYLHAVAQLDHARLCFLNSYAEPLADGWLRMLAGALDAPKAGLAGASGSWESQAEWRRGRLGHPPQQPAALPQAGGGAPRLPTPHR